MSGQVNHSTDTYYQTRLLVSLKEAACLLGPNGSKIQNVRSKFNVQCSLTPAIPKCSDRILSISTNATNGGTVEDINGAIGECLQILIEEFPLSVESNEKKLYNYGPLNHILPVSENCSGIGYLRVILNDNQISIIIGERGSRIKALISKYEDKIKIVASKNYLPDSDDRILEIQGKPEHVVEILNDIDAILLEINHTINNKFSDEVARDSHGSHNNEYNEDFENGDDVDEEGYHHTNYTSTSTSSNGHHHTAHNISRKKHYFPHYNYTKTLEIPKEYVGIMMGKNGNRIINLKSFTNTNILVSKEDHTLPTRFFTITSDKEQNVEKAYILLRSNYENIEK